AEGLRGDPADEDDYVIGALDAVGEVVEDAPKFAGGAGGDDDAGAALRVDVFALLGAGGEGDARETEEILLADELIGLVIVLFAELAVDAADLDAHWAVHEHGDGGNQFLRDELLHVPEHRLRAPDGERWDEQAAALGDAPGDGVEQLRLDGGDGAVGIVAVGAVGDD